VRREREKKKSPNQYGKRKKGALGKRKRSIQKSGGGEKMGKGKGQLKEGKKGWGQWKEKEFKTFERKARAHTLEESRVPVGGKKKKEGRGKGGEKGLQIEQR